MAYLRGGVTWICIDDFGEANGELLLWGIILPILVFGTCLSLKELTDD